MAPSKSKKVDKEDSKDEDSRMWASIVFGLILFVIGLPLWWHLTTVERVELPTSRIERLNHTSIYVRTNISVVTNDAALSEKIVADLRDKLQGSDFLKFHFSVGQIDKTLVLTPEVLEQTPDVHPKVPGVYQFVLCPEMTSNKVLFGAHRTMYFSKNVDIGSLAETIVDSLIQESSLVHAKDSVSIPGYVLKHQDKDTQRRVRLSSHFDLIFSIIVSDAANVKVEWDFQSATEGYIKPLLEQLYEMSNYTVKSQWLFHISLEQSPRKTKDGYSISHRQMSQIVSTLENKLGSYASNNPVLHFVLYTTECQNVPLFFEVNNVQSSAIISDRWGSIQIVNPNVEQHCQGEEIFSPDVHPVMSRFISDLKQLMGVKNHDTMKNVDIVPYNAALLAKWEIDALYRIRTVEQIAASKLILNSLIQLLDQISNIVITSQIGDAVYTAVNNAEAAEEALDFGDLDSALQFSRSAYNNSEQAFTHPSLLALLYFPDDQKYAVYIPLFLPVMIPVVLSFNSIVSWVKKKIPHDIMQHIHIPCIPDQTQLYDDADKTDE